MRRSLSIFLMLLLGFGPLAATLEASDDARLPACCRRLGAHHCAMPDALITSMARVESRTPIVTAPSHCPLYPGAALATLASPRALAASRAELPSQSEQSCIPHLKNNSVLTRQIQTLADRGPPASSFS